MRSRDGYQKWKLSHYLPRGGPRGGVFTFGYFINQTGGLIFACAFVSGEEEHFGHSIGHDGYNLG